MADTNSKPGTTIAKTQSKILAINTEKLEAARKNNDRSLPKKADPKVLRDMTVSYVSIRHYDRKTNRTKHYTRSASLRLNGIWMEEAGFTTGTKLDVRVMPGCLILTVQEPQPETAEPEVLTQLRQACKKLSARKQRQIAEFIQVIAKPQKRVERQG